MLKLIGVALSILASFVITASAATQQLRSAHFAISYQERFGTSQDSYARLVQRSLESAYDLFTEAGFEILPGRIEVEILETNAGELGAEYLEFDENGDPIAHIEIASESIMTDYLTYAYVESSIEDLVLSTCAHELFHVVQDTHSLYGTGDMSEQSFVEPHATAIQEHVVPDANDYLDPALEFLLAPDSIAFFQRSYDAGIFWVYVLDRFGIQSIKDLMTASARHDGRHAADRAFASRGFTFFEVWADFALALATATLPDSNVLHTLVPVAEGSGWWQRDREPALVPPLVYQGTWTGETLDIHTVNAANESEYVPTYEDDPIGSKLRVAHAYGIDILEIQVASAAPMEIEFSGDASTQFLTSIALEIGGSWSTSTFESVFAPQLDETTRFRIVITRSEPGTGDYNLIIRPG